MMHFTFKEFFFHLVMFGVSGWMTLYVASTNLTNALNRIESDCFEFFSSLVLVLFLFTATFYFLRNVGRVIERWTKIATIVDYARLLLKEVPSGEVEVRWLDTVVTIASSHRCYQLNWWYNVRGEKSHHKSVGIWNSKKVLVNGGYYVADLDEVKQCLMDAYYYYLLLVKDEDEAVSMNVAVEYTLR